ncbi:calcineurin B-like protein CBL10 [Pyrus ussuriensis x Pyrus communis]|uniref:Calcineurin B-like protein n=1 Tax=Pyrus ussuriensis x Pyrus communis TaxID=2448454 RepID=A0A5N5GCD4_9ROSA|nr:calcineurin B-like protein CBL10 [Pyrus ussuriensis x Pyrus communis]
MAERPRLQIRDLLFRIDYSAYSFTTSSSSLKIGETLCAFCRPLIGLVEAFIFSLAGCFDCHCQPHRLSFTHDDVVRLAATSPFSVNEVEALRELFNKLSSSILDDGLLHKEELRLALFKTLAGENLFLDRVFDVFDEKKDGVIEFEEFVHALSVFHPYASLEAKIDFAFRLYDLRQTGYIGREEVRQMVVATLLESGIQMPDETLEAIVDKARIDCWFKRPAESNVHITCLLCSVFHQYAPLEAKIDFAFRLYRAGRSIFIFTLSKLCFLAQTFEDADADREEKISKDDWKAYAIRYPALLKNMTLPYLKYLSLTVIPLCSTIFHILLQSISSPKRTSQLFFQVFSSTLEFNTLYCYRKPDNQNQNPPVTRNSSVSLGLIELPKLNVHNLCPFIRFPG